jgi:hypothetical protein
MGRVKRSIAIAGVLFAGACGDDPVTSRPARWSYISAAIIQPSCATASCHTKLSRTYGLELETREGGYVNLVGGRLVVPGRPDQSKLVYLLRGIEVTRMPPDAPLPDADVALIERWILEGAAND